MRQAGTAEDTIMSGCHAKIEKKGNKIKCILFPQTYIFHATHNNISQHFTTFVKTSDTFIIITTL